MTESVDTDQSGKTVSLPEGTWNGHVSSPAGGEGYVAAIDLGGTKILAAIFAPDGQVVARAKKATGKDHSPAVVIDRMAECVWEAAKAAGISAADLKGAGVGAPGPIEAGVVKVAPNLGWTDVPLSAELRTRLKVPTATDNDVRVAVIAEHAAGAGRGVKNMIGLWPGTGVGGGLVLNGEIYTGAGGLAGELGHITILAGGPRCGCGGRGHLEALASRTAIVRDIVAAARDGERTELTKIVGKRLQDTTSGDLAKAWRKGDKLVSRVLERAAANLALGIASIANALNPELVVLGGGVIEALGDPFVERIAKRLKKEPLFGSTGAVRLAKSELADDAGITGAAILARRAALSG